MSIIKKIILLVFVSFGALTGCSEKEENVPDTTNSLEELPNKTEQTEELPDMTGQLLEAVETQDAEKIRELLDKENVNIDEINADGETPLLIATHENYIEIAKLLIDAGADVNIQDNISDSPYLYAGAEGKTEILAYMLENAEPNQQIFNRFGGNALIPAAEKGHLENVKLLLEDGRVDIDHQNNYGYTALIEAVALRNGSQVYVDITQVLLDYGANQNLRDNNQKTALEYAKQLGYTEIIELLENHK